MASTPDYTVEQKRYARYLYETEGLSIPAIRKDMGASLQTLNTWKKSQEWLAKGEKAEDFEDWTRQRFLKIAEEKGFGINKTIETLIEGIEKPVKTIFGKNGESIIDTDYSVRHKFLNSFLNVSGLLNTGGKVGIEAGDGAILNIQINHPGKE